MPLASLRVRGYRSLSNLRLTFEGLTLVLGANGAGKTNVYRALHLLHAAATGTLARTIALEGGMPSVLWAGPRQKRSKKEPLRMHIGVELCLAPGDPPATAFELQCGLPVPAPGTHPGGQTLFQHDPEVKRELGSVLHGRRPTVLVDRDHTSATLRDEEGLRRTYPHALHKGESILSQLQDPHRFPLLSALRNELSSWRFYHHFRTDPEAPARAPQVGTHTPALAHDGSDLAAALQTIREIGDARALERALDRAFPGATLSVELGEEGRLRLELQMPGLYRGMNARELSDGTLRYLSLMAALLSPRPPALLILNEPETSLHPDLLEPLGALVTEASAQTQVIVTTHSDALAQSTCVSPVRLQKVDGATRLEDTRAEEDDDREADASDR